MEKSSEMKDIVERREKIKKWFSDYENIGFFILAVSIIIIYVYYFFKIGIQPIWFDEGDYLSIAKIWALNLPKPEWWAHFIFMRPVFLPFIWSLLFKLGSSELIVRFLTLLIPSVITCFLTYKFSESLFNKKVALISTAIFSFNWVWLFYTYRLLTDIPSTFFAVLSFYFFWAVYEKKGKNYGLYLSVVFGIFSFMTRYTGMLVLISIILYLFITRRLSLFKDKAMYKAFILGVICLIPFLLFNFSTFGNVFPALSFYHGAQSALKSEPPGWEILSSHLPNLFGKIQLVLFVIGFLLLFEIFLFIDLLIKKEEKSRNNLLFSLIVILTSLSFFIFGIKHIDPRYLLFVFPVFTAVSAYGLYFIIEIILKSIIPKKLLSILFIAFLFAILFIQLPQANNFIKIKETSYKEIQEVGLWFKQNTPKDTILITASITQNEYYSERDTYDFYVRNETDIEGIHNEDLFNKKVEKLNPDYLVLSAFEPVFTPQWAYDYPQRHNLTFVKSFGNYEGQPLLVLYKFNK